MSSIDALSVAANSLAATQQQLAIVSQNIGNAQNQNYNARNAQTESQGSDGAFVTVSVTRAVNEILQNEMLGQTTTAGGASVTNQMYSQLEALTGGNTTSPVLDQAMQQLVNAFQGYQTSPESAAAQSGVVSAAQNLVSTIQTVSTGLTNLQFQTQQNVQTDVTTLNTTLSQINGLNDQIKAQMAAGQDVGGLQDQRDALISTVATMIPVRQQVNADGTVYLSTPGGMALVDGAAAQFSYQPPPTYTPGYTSAGATTPTPNNADSAGIIYLSSDPSKTPLNASFGTGQIGSELNSLRTDTAALNSSDPSMGTIAKAQQQLSYLSEQFYDPNAGTVGGTSYGTEFQQVFGGIGSTSGDTTNAANNFTNSLFTSTDGNAATPGSLQVNPALVGANPTENISDILTQGDAANVVNFMSTGSATVTDASNGATTTINYTFPGNNGGATGVPGDISGQTIAFGDVAQLFATSEASRASQAQDASQSATTSLSTTTTSYHAQTGVSIDQQLELMVVLQNSYNAASKIIGTMSQLQQQLFNAA